MKPSQCFSLGEKIQGTAIHIIVEAMDDEADTITVKVEKGHWAWTQFQEGKSYVMRRGVDSDGKGICKGICDEWCPEDSRLPWFGIGRAVKNGHKWFEHYR